MPEWVRSTSEVLSMLQDVVQIDSVNPALPGGGRGEGEMVDYIEQFFTALEIPCQRREVMDGRANILATLEGQDPNRTLPEKPLGIRIGMVFGPVPSNSEIAKR